MRDGWGKTLVLCLGALLLLGIALDVVVRLTLH